MDNSDEVLNGAQAEGEMLVWMLEQMGHARACELCGTLTAPGDLIESRVRTIRQLDMGAVIGQIGMAPESAQSGCARPALSPSWGFMSRPGSRLMGGSAM